MSAGSRWEVSKGLTSWMGVSEAEARRLLRRAHSSRWADQHRAMMRVPGREVQLPDGRRLRYGVK